MIQNWLKETPQTLTADWVDYGTEIACGNKENFLLWLELDINDSENVQVRGRLRYLEGYSKVFDTPNREVDAGVTKIQPDVYEYEVDADQNVPLQWQLDKAIASIQIQIKAGTVGATPGAILSGYYTMEG